MQYREFMFLTEEIRQIVSDMFCPKKITCIRRYKSQDVITCKIYTGWQADCSHAEGGVRFKNKHPRSELHIGRTR